MATTRTYKSVQPCNCGRQCRACGDCAAPGSAYCGPGRCNAETFGGRADEDTRK